MDKRTVLAIILAIVVMYSYSTILQKMYPSSAKSLPLNTSANPKTTGALAVSQQYHPDNSQSLPQNISTESELAVSQQYHPDSANVSSLPETNFRKLITKDVDYELSDAGACITSIYVKNYNNAKQQVRELIYNSEFLQKSIFNINGSIDGNDTSKTYYKYLKNDTGAEYSSDFPNGVKIKKIYKVLNNRYGMELAFQVTNDSLKQVTGNYSIIAVSNIQATTKEEERFLVAKMLLNGKQIKNSPQNVKVSKIYTGGPDWVTGQNKYFSIVVKPYQLAVSLAVSQQYHNSKPNICIELQSEKIKLEPGESLTHRFLLYSGPIDYDLMAEFQTGIEQSVDYGVFGGISKFLLWILKFLYNVFHNYGVAIILLAIFVTLLMYPFTIKTFKSMKQMQALQPKVDKLRKEFKDNPQKLNKETLELYKKYKVNPFSGCLPMLLQMPIFLALYQALSRAIELKNAGFLWIKDLSAPDRAFLLPYPQGSGASIPINILPILTALAMFLQQKQSLSKSALQSGTGDVAQQQQKMMSFMMPVMFGFIFYSMPSGVVLYWLVNTFIIFLQQMKLKSHACVEEMGM